MDVNVRFQIRRLSFSLVALLIGATLTARSEIGASAKPSAPTEEVHQSWEADYAGLKAAIDNRTNPLNLLKAGESRADVADVQSLI